MKRFIVIIWTLGFFYTYYVTDVRGFEAGGLEQWSGLAIIVMLVSFISIMGWILRCAVSD